MVLGTDMALHFAKNTDFANFANRFGKDPLAWNGDENAMYSLRGWILHSADISNQAKPATTSYQWSMRCLKEFFVQGDNERMLNLPLSPLCDRLKPESGFAV